jgi:two-component system chemotaxis response regulator CheB
MSVTPLPEPKAGVRIRVLIVDDSAFARKVVREMLTEEGDFDVVSAAKDGEEALSLTASMEPDVVICDINMPKINGVEFVSRQMRLRPVPILILSAAAQDASEVIDALDAGAVDVVKKPSALAMNDLLDVRQELVAKIRAAARAPRRAPALAPVPEAAPDLPPAPMPRVSKRFDVVVLGISTGGPQALRRLIPGLAANFPVPVAVVLHMPVGYTSYYSERLNELSRIEVKEAQNGDAMQPGRVLIAQAGRHLSFRRNEKGLVVAVLSMQPLDKIHRPSVDVLFRSAAETYGDKVLAVVMTGMGDDGREGAAWVKAQGGTVLTESENSCVIYGMPRSVVEAGLSRRTLRQSLEGLGLKVEEASDGNQALERFFVSRPQLVLLDMVMSGMYGLEVLAKLRELDPTVKVIIATADIQSSTADQVRAAGAKGILNKPINPEALKVSVAKVLSGGDTWN